MLNKAKKVYIERKMNYYIKISDVKRPLSKSYIYNLIIMISI